MNGLHHTQDSFYVRGVVFDVTGAGTAVSGIAQAAGAVTAASIQADATKHAADVQVGAANRAADMVQGRYDQTRDDFAPYRALGGQASDQLSGRLNELTSTVNPFQDALNSETPVTPGPMTQASLESTPGYQFTLSQGLKAAQSSAAARGLGVSGAALRGASDYATGLSDQTYNTRFNQQEALFGNQQTRFGDTEAQFTNYQGQQTNAYNRLLGATTLGQNSAAQTGALGNTAANQAGNYLTGGASAAGAASIASGNAAAGGINGIANAFSQYNAQNNLFGNTAKDSSVYQATGPFDGPGTQSSSF